MLATLILLCVLLAVLVSTRRIEEQRRWHRPAMSERGRARTVAWAR